jgi:hypothetical protein
MKFLLQHFKPQRLMMPADEDMVVGGGEADDSIDVDSDDYEEEDLDTPIDELGGDPNEILKSRGLDPKKYGLDKDDDEESEEVEQETDEKEEAGRAAAGKVSGDEKSILTFVNSLGAVDGQNQIKVESKDQLKDLLQKGHNYTQKTQALSDERKVFDSEKVEAEKIFSKSVEDFNKSIQTHQKDLRELQQMKHALAKIQKSAPDIFSEFQEAYSAAGEYFDNPVYNQQFAQLKAELDETKKMLSTRENKVILDSFDKDKSAFAATEQSWKELGITVDWDKAKQKWAQTGLSLEETLNSMYASTVLKAMASKSKVDTTKRKVAARPAGAASGSRSGGKLPARKPGQSAFQRAMQMAKTIHV